jgi:ligand-binding sensor domain-containing protein
LPFATTPDFAQVLVEDREGNLWVGSERNGLLCLRPRPVQSFAVANGLASDNAWAVCRAADGSVWIG